MTAPALFTRHQGLARKIASDYHLPGADRDDVQQEALIGLWEAARAHDPSKGAFPAFAATVIRRRLASCLKSAHAQKHQPLTRSARTVPPVSVDDQETRDRIRAIVAAVPTLTTAERKAVADHLNHGRASDDNALYRARVKLKAAA